MRLLACPELRCPCASRLRFYMVVCTGPESLHSMTNLVYMCFPRVYRERFLQVCGFYQV